mgnify:FL=1
MDLNQKSIPARLKSQRFERAFSIFDTVECRQISKLQQLTKETSQGTRKIYASTPAETVKVSTQAHLKSSVQPSVFPSPDETIKGNCALDRQQISRYNV